MTSLEAIQGSRFHRLRTMRKLSLKELSGIPELFYEDVIDYDLGRKEITEQHGLILSSILQCDYDYLMGVEKNG